MASTSSEKEGEGPVSEKRTVTSSNFEEFLWEEYPKEIARWRTYFTKEDAASLGNATCDDNVIFFAPFLNYDLVIENIPSSEGSFNISIKPVDWAKAFNQRDLKGTIEYLKKAVLKEECLKIIKKDQNAQNNVTQLIRVATIWMMTKFHSHVDPWSFPLKFQEIMKLPHRGIEVWRTYFFTARDFQSNINWTAAAHEEKSNVEKEEIKFNDFFRECVENVRKGGQHSMNTAQITCSLARATNPNNINQFVDAVQFPESQWRIAGKQPNIAKIAGKLSNIVIPEFCFQRQPKQFATMDDFLNWMCPVKLLAIYRGAKFIHNRKLSESFRGSWEKFNSEIPEHNVYPLPEQCEEVDAEIYSNLTAMLARLDAHRASKIGQGRSEECEPLKRMPEVVTALSDTLPSLLKSLLGVGGFGIVFRSVNSDGMETAVKYIFPEDEQQFRECQIPMHLHPHENIVKIFAVKQTLLKWKELDDIFWNPPRAILNEKAMQLWCSIEGWENQTMYQTICIQQELCGENLREWLNRKKNLNDPVLQDMQVTIVSNVITGLKYLHDNKIIHRDLNPNNVMFSAVNFQLPVKIGDFGLADTMTRYIGTRMYYRPPEIFYSDLSYTYQSDFYSLGLIIWEVAQLISSDDRDLLFLKYLDLHNEYVIRINHPKMPGVKELILHLTRNRVEDRVQNIKQVVEILQIWKAKSLEATNSADLNLMLKHVTSGCKIALAKGIYRGSFFLERDGVEIIGVGEETVLQSQSGSCLKVVGKGCAISGMKIMAGPENKGIEVIGSGNKIENVQFFGGECCLDVTGNENIMENLAISYQKTGIIINGRRNIVEQVKISEIMPISGVRREAKIATDFVAGISEKWQKWLQAGDKFGPKISL